MDSVLEVVLTVNEDYVTERKGDEPTMCEALRRIVADEIKEALETAEKEAILRGEAQGMEQGMAKGMAEGMEKGMKQGMEQGRNDIIEGALKNGNTLEQVSAFLNIPLEEVRKVEEKMMQKA